MLFFKKIKEKKWVKKWKAIKKNSQQTRTIGSVASNIIDSESESEIDPNETLIRKRLEMIRISDAEEGSKWIRKTDLKNVDDIDLEEYKSYYNIKSPGDYIWFFWVQKILLCLLHLSCTF